MLAAVRLTSKIERRLKKLEREFTRPMPAMNAARTTGRVEPRFESPAFPALPDLEAVPRDLADNDNVSAPVVALAPVQAPPVALGRDGPSEAAPSVTIDAPPRPAAEAPKTVKSTPKPASRPIVARGPALGLPILAAAAFLVSFAVVYTIA